MLFQRVGAATKCQAFIIDGIIGLLKEELCFTAWKLNFRKNIPETNAILRRIGGTFYSQRLYNGEIIRNICTGFSENI